MSLPVTLLMYIVHRHAESRVIAGLASRGYPLTPAQARLAARLSPEGDRLTALAEAAGVTKQSAGALVDQLERAGYVERVPDPSDARARLVRLAERGLAAQACAREVEQAVEAELTAHLGAARMGELRASMEALREVTDPYL